uniref:Fibronectin type-III domain-containing protein n=1 Tax=Lates calcarifer TaxID=8187 RepID=A0A4W6FM33_LATCA
MKQTDMSTAAVGRPFQLGMLYDCRKDALIPGVTLWDLKELQKNTSVQQQNNTEFNVTASDSIEEKSNLLKISGSLKLSLLGGLVNVRGSAKYFQDTKKSQKQARVTLQYNATTKFETLTMSHLAHGQVSHPNVFEDDTATHVVTAILYGAGAYFVFDRESSLEDETKQVEGEANLTFNKLKFLTVDAEASFNMDDKERAAVEKFSCTFHGDFKLPSNPTSFTDAVKVYRTLPDLLGQDGEHAVPLRVWLYPLVKLDSRAARLQRDISRALITCSSETIESLNRTEMRCSDLLKDTAATTFPAMEKKVQDLMQMCCQYKLDFMQKLGSVLPSIRGGGKEESVLEEILKAHERSPFNNKDLDQWLKTKGKESDTLKSFLKQLDKLGVKMEDHLDDLLSDLDVRNVVCFSFTSVDQPDGFLVKLSNHLRPAGMVDSAGSSDLRDTNTDWLSSDTRQTMRKQLKLFGELKKSSNSDDTKFIVTSKYAESHPGACIFIYEDGCDDAVCFVSPSKPATPSTTASHDSFTVTVSEPDSVTVEYTVDYREKQQQDTEWTSHPVKKNQETVTLSGLKPDTEYEIRATAVGKLSYAVSSDVCRAVTLTAVGPPTQVKDTEVKANSITLTWSNPSVQRCESVKQFIIEFREENSSQWQSKETREEVYTFTLNSLKQDAVYSVRMCTDGGVGVSQPGEELKVKTKKEPLDTKKSTLIQGNPPVYLLKLKPAGVINHRVVGFHIW